MASPTPISRIPTGLTAQNVSTANDLAKMVQAAAEYPMIREFSTTGSAMVEIQATGQVLGFNNTNMLVKSPKWDIQVSKTGYIREAGKCLVMLATISSRPFVIVLLDSLGKYTRVGRRPAGEALARDRRFGRRRRAQGAAPRTREGRHAVHAEERQVPHQGHAAGGLRPAR